MRKQDFLPEQDSDFLDRLRRPSSLDTIDDSDEENDYHDKVYSRMGWGNNPANDRRTPNRVLQQRLRARSSGDNDDSSYYDNSKPQVKQVIDELEKIAERHGATFQVDRWNADKNWQVGILLPNDKNFRVKLDREGNIINFDIAYGRVSDDPRPAIVAYLNKAFNEKNIDLTATVSGQYLINFVSNERLGISDFEKYFVFLKNIISKDPSAFKMIRSGPGDINQASDRVKTLVKNDLTEENYYIGIANVIYNAVKFGIRDFLPQRGKERDNIFDLDNKGITVGYTERARDLIDNPTGDTPYREHLVPVDQIIRSAIQMFNNANVGVDIKNITNAEEIMKVDHKLIMDVADMIKRNLMIVLTDYRRESEIIDNKLRLKTVMPQGDKWDPINGDRLSRFKAFNEAYPNDKIVIFNMKNKRVL